MTRQALGSLVHSKDWEEVLSQLPEEADQAQAFRWMLRGLDSAKTIRKVTTDAEIRRNCEKKGLSSRLH